MCKMFLLSWKWDTSHIFLGGTLTPAMFVFARLWKCYIRPMKGLDWRQSTNERPPSQVPAGNWVRLMWPRVLVVTCYSAHVKCHGQQSEKFTDISFRRRERLAVNLIFTSKLHGKTDWAQNKNVFHSCWCNIVTFVKLHHYESCNSILLNDALKDKSFLYLQVHLPSLFRCHPVAHDPCCQNKCTQSRVMTQPDVICNIVSTRVRCHGDPVKHL